MADFEDQPMGLPDPETAAKQSELAYQDALVHNEIVEQIGVVISRAEAANDPALVADGLHKLTEAEARRNAAHTRFARTQAILGLVQGDDVELIGLTHSAIVGEYTRDPANRWPSGAGAILGLEPEEVEEGILEPEPVAESEQRVETPPPRPPAPRREPTPQLSRLAPQRTQVDKLLAAQRARQEEAPQQEVTTPTVEVTDEELQQSIVDYLTGKMKLSDVPPLGRSKKALTAAWSEVDAMPEKPDDWQNLFLELQLR